MGLQIVSGRWAGRLTTAQRSTIFGLDETDFCALGCSEPYAIRLTVEKKRRPALVEEGPRSIDGHRTFRLSRWGVKVKTHLTAFGGTPQR